MSNVDQVAHGKHRAMAVIDLQTKQPRRPPAAAGTTTDTSLA